MLSKYESDVMNAVYSLCDGTDGCLVSATEIISILPPRKKFTPDGIDEALSALHSDGYFDLITSSRMGEKMYVINLNESGLNFRRERRQRQRDAAFRIALAFLGAVATFVFGLILKAITGG